MGQLARLVVWHPDSPLADARAATAELDIRPEPQPAMSPESPVIFYSLQTPTVDQFETALTADHTVTSWEYLTTLDARRFYRITHDETVKFVTPTLAEYRIHVLDTTNVDGGWQFCVHAVDRASITSFHDYCQQEDVAVEIRELRRASALPSREMGRSRLDLTERQHEVAVTATRMGYFDEEGASAEEVAAALDITPSTLSSHLHAVMETLFTHHFQ